MENLKINKCLCGDGKERMCTLRGDIIGFYIECESCKKKIYANGVSKQDPRSNDLRVVSNLQIGTIANWNANNPEKNTES